MARASEESAQDEPQWLDEPQSAGSADREIWRHCRSSKEPPPSAPRKNSPATRWRATSFPKRVAR
eukprot:2618443-Pyramimonas_sp.AAC.1